MLVACNFHNVKLRRRTESGTSLPELMISALLVGTFFASIFELNAVLLRYISGTKENVGAIESVQDRVEKLRSLAFSDLLDPAKMKATSPAESVVLVNAPNASDFAAQVAEEITVTDLNDPARSITYTRAAGKTVTPTHTAAGAFSATPKTTVVKVKVKHSWRMTLGRRDRTEESETIISDGIKK